MIVADATPIIAFARSGHLDLLGKVARELVIPEAVNREITVKGEDKPGAEKVKSAGWIKVKEIKDESKLESLPSNLGKGERESIILAQEHQALLVTDDYQARKVARKQELKVASSLNILQEAKSRGIISKVKKPLDDLIATGFYITPEIYKEILRKAGELSK